MLTKEFRKTHSGGPGGYRCACCDSDGRKHKQVRRSARRIEKQAWKKEIH